MTIPADTCESCKRSLLVTGGSRIIAGHKLKVSQPLDPEGKRNWLCQSCAGLVCSKCKANMVLPLGADVLHDDGSVGHQMIVPLGDKICSNENCENYRKLEWVASDQKLGPSV